MREISWFPCCVGAAAAALLLTLSSGCADKASPPPAPRDEVPPTAATLGRDGGTLKAGHAEVRVPDGALDGEVPMVLEGAEAHPGGDGMDPAGPTVRVGPAGAELEAPVEVILPVDEGRLPRGRTLDDARIYRGDSLDGPFAALPTEVLAAEGDEPPRLRALSARLGVFVPGLRGLPPALAACAGRKDCDCAAVAAVAPLQILARGAVDGRRLFQLCWRPEGGDAALDDGAPPADRDQVVVWSARYPDGDGVQFPDAYFRTWLDAATLAPLGEEEVANRAMQGEHCTARTLATDNHFLRWEAGGASFRASLVEIDERALRTGAEWTEGRLRIEAEGGSLELSFNRHLNLASPYEDDESLFDRTASLAATVHPGGLMRAYLHVFHTGHVDVLQVDDLGAALADPTRLGRDSEGRAQADRTLRFAGRDGQSSLGRSTRSIHAAIDPANPGADVVLLFDAPTAGDDQPGTVRGYRVDTDGDGALRFTALPPLPATDVYASLSQQYGGLDANGLLWTQAQGSSFGTSALRVLDPHTFTVVERFALPCLGSPLLRGFQAVPGREGVVVRLASSLGDEAARTDRDGQPYLFLLRHGWPLGVGAVAGGSGRLALVSPGPGERLVVADEDTGEITVVAIP